MYKCPIELITTRIQAETENEIFKAVQKVGVNVDKDELVRALQYDREQYNKGYEDGIRDFEEKLKELIIQENALYSSCVKNQLPTEYQQGYEEKNDSIVRNIDFLAKEMKVGD